MVAATVLVSGMAVSAQEGPEEMCRSYLTGKQVPVSIGRKRPVGLMIENDADAVKWQRGTSYADVMYEAMVEGGITRLEGFFENYRAGLKQIGPNFVGLANFRTILSNPDMWLYAKNTMIMWIGGFIPQIIFSLLLGAWFTDPSLRLKCQRFFKTVIYLPNLIMASAFAMLFSPFNPKTSIGIRFSFAITAAAPSTTPSCFSTTSSMETESYFLASGLVFGSLS